MSEKPIWEIVSELFEDVSEEEWNEFKTAFREGRKCSRCKEFQAEVKELEEENDKLRLRITEIMEPRSVVCPKCKHSFTQNYAWKLS